MSSNASSSGGPAQTRSAPTLTLTFIKPGASAEHTSHSSSEALTKLSMSPTSSQRPVSGGSEGVGSSPAARSLNNIVWPASESAPPVLRDELTVIGLTISLASSDLYNTVCFGPSVFEIPEPNSAHARQDSHVAQIRSSHSPPGERESAYEVEEAFDIHTIYSRHAGEAFLLNTPGEFLVNTTDDYVRGTCDVVTESRVHGIFPISLQRIKTFPGREKLNRRLHSDQMNPAITSSAEAIQLSLPKRDSNIGCSSRRGLSRSIADGMSCELRIVEAICDGDEIFLQSEVVWESEGQPAVRHRRESFRIGCS